MPEAIFRMASIGWLCMYHIQNGLCDPNADPKVLKEGPSTGLVDGCNSLGVVVGEFRHVVHVQVTRVGLMFFKIFSPRKSLNHEIIWRAIL